MGLIAKKDFDHLNFLLDEVIPEKVCEYRKAYAYGLGIMMNYNKNYLKWL